MMLQALPGDLPPTANGARAEISVLLHRDPAGIEPLWRALEANSQTSLHQGFDWCSTWLTTNPQPVLGVEIRLDGVPSMLLPLVVERQRGNRVARFIAHAYSNLNTGLLREDLPPVDPVRLGAALKQALTGEVDLLSLENMPLIWRGRTSPLAGLPFTENQNHAFQLPLQPAFEDTLKQLNAKRRRKKFRLQQRRLEEAGGYDILSALTTAEQHAVLDEFFRQKAARFRSHGLPDVFRERSVQAFFHALIDVPVARDATPLVLHALRLSGAPGAPLLAISGMSRKGDHMICQFGSIRDDLLPEASPGEFLFWHIIEKACHDGVALFDFGIGDQAYKRSWCTIETVQYDVLVAVTVRGQIAASLHRASTRLKAAIKSSARLYALIQRFRARAGDTASQTAPPGEEA